jgi:hypothetical protein
MRVTFKFFGVLGGCAAIAVSIGIAAHAYAQATADKYALKVPGGLAFAEFKGFEGWQAISVSQNDSLLAIILGNKIMIDAFQAGYPDNGKAFPDGAKMAKLHYHPKKSEKAPSPTTVPGAMDDIDFMVKDSKRFADSGGWGYAAFMYDSATRTFRPAGLKDAPPQANDAKCGAGCHTLVKNRDYVFTEYAAR